MLVAVIMVHLLDDFLSVRIFFFLKKRIQNIWVYKVQFFLIFSLEIPKLVWTRCCILANVVPRRICTYTDPYTQIIHIHIFHSFWTINHNRVMHLKVISHISFNGLFKITELLKRSTMRFHQYSFSYKEISSELSVTGFKAF